MRKVTHNPQFFYNPNADSAYLYALNIIEDRWQEAEPYIMKDHHCAYQYARDIIKGRWKEAEQYIMKDPHYSCYYAIKIIGKRWEEAEPCIQLYKGWEYYKRYFHIELH